MSDSNKRALRTWLHAFLGLVTSAPIAIPVIISIIRSNPTTAQISPDVLGVAVAIAAWCGVISKTINFLEDRFPGFPALLKGDTPAGPVVSGEVLSSTVDESDWPETPQPVPLPVEQATAGASVDATPAPVDAAPTVPPVLPAA